MTTKVPVELLSINGGELVLDADGDTSITADTDDQIDFKVGGTDRLSLPGGAKFPADTHPWNNYQPMDPQNNKFMSV